MTFALGLTGSIGMGKSTTAQMFAEEGCAVWDADAVVHRLYASGGAAVDPIAERYPEAIVAGAVCRKRLRDIMARDAGALKIIEGVVHPLVAADRTAFLADPPTQIVVLDIPLLFETGGAAAMDAVACVTVSDDVQEQRVLDRGTMTADEFRRIRDRQMPNAQKCAASDFVIVTDSIEHARAQVQSIIRQIRERLEDA